MEEAGAGPSSLPNSASPGQRSLESEAPSDPQLPSRPASLDPASLYPYSMKEKMEMNINSNVLNKSASDRKRLWMGLEGWICWSE